MIKKYVISSNLEWVDYEENSKKLRIGFRSGRVYEYSSVPMSKYTGLLEASSLGKYFNRFIKGKYFEKRIG